MDATGASAGGAERIGVRDVSIACGLVVVLAVLFRLGFQARMANDGPVLASLFVQVEDAVHWQVLYLPAARLLARLVGGGHGDPFEPLRLLNVLAAGVGVGGSFLLARGFGARRAFALGGALLLALSPFCWFFATSIEVHALNFGMVAACACGTLFGPWRRPALAIPMAAALYSCTFLSHGTGPFMGLGWVLLVGYGRARRAEPFSIRMLLLVVAPILLVSVVALIVAVKAWWLATFDANPRLEQDIITGFKGVTGSASFAWHGFLRPLALLVPVAAVGLVALARRDRAAARTVAVVLIPPWLFLFWWGVAEQGGYFLGQAPFLGVLAAAALSTLSRRSLVIVPGFLLLQGMVAWTTIRHFDDTLDPRVRVELVRELLPGGGMVGTIGYLAPDLAIQLPDVVEVDFTGRIRTSYAGGVSAEELSSAVAKTLAAALTQGPVILDLSHRSVDWDTVPGDFLDHVDAFERGLLDRFETERFERGGWVLIVLRDPSE